MLVEVKPLPSKKWHGKVDKESFTQPKVVEVLPDTDTGKYRTGLTTKEAEEKGKELGVDLSDNFNPEVPHPFWGSKQAWMVLPNYTVILNDEKPYEFIKIRNMKASGKVANSMKEWEEGQWPQATHVIFDEAEEVELKASKIALKRTAGKIADNMSLEAKISMVWVLSNKSVKKMSPNFIEVEIEAIIDEKAAEFIKYADMGKEEVTTRAQVLEMLNKNILTREQGSIYYMGELVGLDFEDAVGWFKNPNNQKLKVMILDKLDK